MPTKAISNAFIITDHYFNFRDCNEQISSEREKKKRGRKCNDAIKFVTEVERH